MCLIEMIKKAMLFMCTTPPGSIKDYYAHFGYKYMTPLGSVHYTKNCQRSNTRGEIAYLSIC